MTNKPNLHVVIDNGDTGGGKTAAPLSNIILDTNVFFLDQGVRPFLHAYQDCLSRAFTTCVHTYFTADSEEAPIPYSPFQGILDDIETGGFSTISAMIRRAIELDGDRVTSLDDPNIAAFEQEHAQGFYDDKVPQGVKSLLLGIQKAKESLSQGHPSIQVQWFLTNTHIGVLPQYSMQLSAAFFRAISNAPVPGRLITSSYMRDMDASSGLFITSPESPHAAFAREIGFKTMPVDPRQALPLDPRMVIARLGTRTP